MIEIFNNQRKIKIDLPPFQAFTENAVEIVAEARGKSLTIAFVSDRKMSELNKIFRGKNTTTDVLSFPHEADEFDAAENYLGDIAISLEQAQKQATENTLDFATEIKQLILHGILHLCGYDHETDGGTMNSLELEIRDKLNL